MKIAELYTAANKSINSFSYHLVEILDLRTQTKPNCSHVFERTRDYIFFIGLWNYHAGQP